MKQPYFCFLKINTWVKNWDNKYTNKIQIILWMAGWLNQWIITTISILLARLPIRPFVSAGKITFFPHCEMPNRPTNTFQWGIAISWRLGFRLHGWHTHWQARHSWIHSALLTHPELHKNYFRAWNDVVDWDVFIVAPNRLEQNRAGQFVVWLVA